MAGAGMEGLRDQGMALLQEIIRRKRLGLILDGEEIGALVRALATGHASDAQAGAFAMAVCLRGMSEAETVLLTLAMRDSGRVLAWDELPGPALDKHSTGGIGDKVSLVLAPIVAACGGFVPMISGRGLGHTGGTLDKLESIPGYRTVVDTAVFRRVVREAGCAIVGATDDLAPADRRLYAIRDMTGTVDSLPLIVSSIVAKKLAGGAGALVMDVKTGSGAFLTTRAEAEELAGTIVRVAGDAGLPCRALLTEMSQCLGRTAGNAIEVEEAVATLRGEPGDPRLWAVTRRLAAHLLELGDLAPTMERAEAMVDRALGSGAAAERFGRMVRMLGGPSDLIERPASLLPHAPVVVAARSLDAGWVADIDARALGLAVVSLGGGRSATAASVDHGVGLGSVKGLGEPVAADEPLALVHARDEASAARAVAEVLAAYRIAPSALPPPAPVLATIG
jgi:thymidine phosphorylase